MNFSRDTLPQNALTSEPAALCARLNPGQWLIEAQANPPAAHDPALLPLGDGLMGAVALSLSSGTAIAMSLGPALAERVMALGPSPGPLAGLALHELIVNAVVHGNLHVKSGRSGGWDDIANRQVRIAESLADPQRCRRVVTIAVGWRRTEVIAGITDEGDGYDSGSEPVPSRAAGRGLRLARMVGRVEVRYGGRQTLITMQAAPHREAG